MRLSVAVTAIERVEYFDTPGRTTKWNLLFKKGSVTGHTDNPVYVINVLESIALLAATAVNANHGRFEIDVNDIFEDSGDLETARYENGVARYLPHVR